MASRKEVHKGDLRRELRLAPNPRFPVRAVPIAVGGIYSISSSSSGIAPPLCSRPVDCPREMLPSLTSQGFPLIAGVCGKAGPCEGRGARGCERVALGRGVCSGSGTDAVVGVMRASLDVLCV